MSEPESSKPADREPSPDATVRLSRGKPTDPGPAPDATVRLLAGNPTDPGLVPESTMRLPAGNPAKPAPALEPTVQLVAGNPKATTPAPEPTVQLIVGSPKEPAPALEPTVQLITGQPQETAFAPEATMRMAAGLPTDPVVAPNATVRLSGGRLLDTTARPEPTVNLGALLPGDPRSTQQLNISNIISQHLDLGGTSHPTHPEPSSSSEDTHKMPRPKLDDPPIRVQKVDQPAEAVGQTQRLPLPAEARQTFGWKLPLALGVGVLVVAATILVVARGRAPQAAIVPASELSPIATESVPPGAQAYLDKAKAGDVHAMRMLGVMFYNGLNVPQNREKGLYWYRKAAENGSEAARSELSKIEGGH